MVCTIQTLSWQKIPSIFRHAEIPRTFLSVGARTISGAGNIGLYNPNFWFVQSKKRKNTENLAGACHFYVP
jgi:hypothetical protein